MTHQKHAAGPSGVTVVLAFAAAPMLVTRAMSCDGSIHGAFANVNGNFGFLGAAGGTPGYHDAVAQETGATGYNNSAASASCNGS
jgi:hypothetical protein